MRGLDDKQLTMLRECTYDQGGYFIVNGTEKVLIAHERSKMNSVMVYKKRKGKFSWTGECRSQNMEVSSVKCQFSTIMTVFMHLFSQ